MPLVFCLSHNQTLTARIEMAHDGKEYTGRRLAAVLLDDLSKRVPERRFGLIPNSQKISDGFREVTIGDLAQAVNYTSWWIEKTLSRKTKSQTVSYMAANDIRYGIFVLACNKTGYNVDSYLKHLFRSRLTCVGFATFYEKLG
jgi:hypothetical protein